MLRDQLLANMELRVRYFTEKVRGSKKSETFPNFSNRPMRSKILTIFFDTG